MWISFEKATQVLRSQFIERLEDHPFRLIADELFDGPPAQSFDEWPAWGVKAAIRSNPGCTVLKLLKLVDFARTTATPNRTTRSKVRLNNTCVKILKSYPW